MTERQKNRVLKSKQQLCFLSWKRSCEQAAAQRPRDMTGSQFQSRCPRARRPTSELRARTSAALSSFFRTRQAEHVVCYPWVLSLALALNYGWSHVVGIGSGPLDRDIDISFFPARDSWTLPEALDVYWMPRSDCSLI